MVWVRYMRGNLKRFQKASAETEKSIASDWTMDEDVCYNS